MSLTADSISNSKDKNIKKDKKIIIMQKKLKINIKSVLKNKK